MALCKHTLFAHSKPTARFAIIYIYTKRLLNPLQNDAWQFFPLEASSMLLLFYSAVATDRI